MDLSQGFDVRAAAESGAWMQVLHPATDEELGVSDGRPCRIQILGADSTGYEEAVAKTASLKASDGTKKGKVSARQILDAVRTNEQRQAEELASITVDWENIEWKGERLEFSEENAAMVYREHGWLRQQLITFFADRTNYLGKD